MKVTFLILIIILSIRIKLNVVKIIILASINLKIIKNNLYFNL